MKKVIIFCSLIMTLSCKHKENKSFSINQPTKSIPLLKNNVINIGDTAAYYELFNEYVDNNRESDFFYYSYIMAFRYNYPKAYMDVFFILCKVYNINTNIEKIDLSKMDLQSQKIAIECLKKASQLNYLNSKQVYESILQGRKE